MIFDKRFYAIRDDLADIRLKGRLTAKRFVSGKPCIITKPLTGLFEKPSIKSQKLCELLYGSRVMRFDSKNNWHWVQHQTDGYVGYIAADALGEDIIDFSHYVAVPYTGVYDAADVKAPLLFSLPLNSRVSIIADSCKNGFVMDSNNHYLFGRHFRRKEDYARDFVSVALQFLYTPYLWGGDSWLGIDCSGLIAQSLRACGVSCPRDSDIQQLQIGRIVDSSSLHRGDLVFFERHVGLMLNDSDLLHSHAGSLQVEIEPLAQVYGRIGLALCCRRLDADLAESHY